MTEKPLWKATVSSTVDRRMLAILSYPMPYDTPTSYGVTYSHLIDSFLGLECLMQQIWFHS